jgi:hypothetical protein
VKKQLLIPFLAAMACAPAASNGQSFSPAASGTFVSAPARRERLGTLSPQERTVLIAVGQKARQDPKVREAAEKMRNARKALNAAMVAKDNTLRPILDKVEAASSPGGIPPRLTGDEREQLRAAREAMKGTPEADAWQKASADYHQAVREAVIAADPSAAPILEKMGTGGMGGGS